MRVVVSGDTLRDSTRKVAAAARRNLGPHPPVERWVAYQAGELAAEDEARLQDHLGLCPECTRTVLELAAATGDGTEAATDGATAAAAVVPLRRGERQGTRGRGGAGAGARGAGRRRRERLLVGLAASLLLATVGLAYRTVVLEGRVAAGPAARGDLPLFTLTAEGETRARGEERLRVPGDGFNLALYLRDPGAHATYALTAVPVVAPPAPRPVWRLDHLAPTAEGIFLVVGLSRRELPAGAYALRLYGGEAPGTLLAEYPVAIEYD